MKIQSKLLIAFIIVSIIPLIIMGLYSYYIAFAKTQDKLDELSFSELIQIQKMFDSKTTRVNKYLDVLFRNRQIQQNMRDHHFNRISGETYIMRNDLDQMLRSFFESETDVESIALITPSNGYYVCDGFFTNIEEIEQSNWYNQIYEGDGDIVWTGMQKNPNITSENKNCIIVGRIVKDISYRKDMQSLGMIVFLLDQNSLFNVYQKNMDDVNNCVIFSDANGAILYGTDNVYAEAIGEFSYDERVLNNSEGFFFRNIDGTKYKITYSTSLITGWKIIRVLTSDYYMSEIVTIGWFTGIIILLSCVLANIVSIIMSNKMTFPIRQLATAMKDVGADNFDILLPIKSQDEIGVLVEGFNKMLANIKTLFEKTIEQEKHKKYAQIQALHYQMNPHFLYNTLASISITATMQNAGKVAEMIRVLNRLLRNVITYSEHLIDIKHEVNNIKDYLYLQQIRYNNRIIVSYSIKGDIGNCKLPVMILQPIVENSIHHGLSRKLNSNTQKAYVNIKIYKEDDKIIIKVTDNGRGMTEQQINEIFKDERKLYDPQHMGIKNIYDRIKLYFGEEYGVSIESRIGKYTSVTICLPVIYGGIKNTKKVNIHHLS